MEKNLWINIEKKNDWHLPKVILAVRKILSTNEIWSIKAIFSHTRYQKYILNEK